LHGFLCVNKPQGLTSFDTLRKLKKGVPRIKLGHLGTLDPMATGVLPVAIGHATRLIEYIPDDTKTYIATMTLGGTSDTQDAWGEVTITRNTAFNISSLENILKEYTGIINQIPPMYSAVHYEGQRLYELARKGISVDRAPRQVEIHSLKLLNINSNAQGLPLVRLKIICSKGTYIRTLCHDIGQSLGCGGYMSELIRTQSGIFNIEQAQGLDDILVKGVSACLLPLDYPLQTLAKIELAGNNEYKSILNGNPIYGYNDCRPGLVRVYYANKLISIARCISNNERNVIKPLKVLK
jgi:tRNA pseudouridine55 synthase